MSSKESSLVQRTYLQKSKLFLLPLTNLKDKYYKMMNTYVSSDDLISEQYPYGISIADEILIVTYPKECKKDSENDLLSSWSKFEIDTLLSNDSFLAFHETDNEYIYTYDISDWHIDWNHFMNGKYSQFSEKAKKKITDFRYDSLTKTARNKLYCYLHPNEEECVKAFAEELKVEVQDLLRIKELCNKPNFELEAYKCLIKENS